MLTTERESDGIAVVTIHMPGRAMNVLDLPLVAALDAEIAALREDAAVTGIILTSAKPTFIAGADLALLRDMEGCAKDIARRLGAVGDAFRRIETCGKPVVAAAPGTALGGGLELMLACHYRIAADTEGAVFGLPEVTLGVLPGAGGTQRLPRLLGIAAALPLLLEGRALPAAEALKAGIVHEVVPAEDLLHRARQVLREGKVSAVAPWDMKGFALPGGAPSSAPVMDTFSLFNGRIHGAMRHTQPAPQAILACVYEGTRLPMDKALKLEQKRLGLLLAGPEARAMIRTLFFARQAANKLARRPAGVPKSRVARLGVIGAGFMGRGIAQVSALAGIEVVLVDRDAAAAEAARATLAADLDAQVEKKRLSPEAREAALARLTAGADFAALAGCDLAIEAVFEDRALKAEVIRAAEAAIGPDAVLATNTSSLPIGDLATAATRPGQMAGLHFFSPVPRMALVEVVRGPMTSDASLARALDYVAQIRKTPILVNDGLGFYTTRCVEAFIREGLLLLADGVPPAVIENSAVALGMPVGPLALADEVGIDVLHHIKEEARAARGAAYVPDTADALYDRLTAEGRYGRKAKSGFYIYDAAGKRLADDLKPEAPAAFVPAEVKKRLLFAQLAAAAGAYDEGIVDDVAEADLGAVLGWAFPRHLGGPFAVMDRDGLPRFLAEADRLASTHGARFAPPDRLRVLADRGEHLFPRAAG